MQKTDYTAWRVLLCLQISAPGHARLVWSSRVRTIKLVTRKWTPEIRADVMAQVGRLVSYLVGALSPVNHTGLHQG